jgi:hypothetical protein
MNKIILLLKFTRNWRKNGLFVYLFIMLAYLLGVSVLMSLYAYIGHASSSYTLASNIIKMK